MWDERNSVYLSLSLPLENEEGRANAENEILFVPLRTGFPLFPRASPWPFPLHYMCAALAPRPTEERGVRPLLLVKDSLELMSPSYVYLVVMREICRYPSLFLSLAA